MAGQKSDGAASGVLLALDDQECARHCIHRALELSRALDTTLHVVRIIPARRWLWRLFPRLRARAREQAKVALRETRFWLAGAYGAEPRAGQVVVRSGDFLQELREHAQRRPTSMIVIPPHLRGVGRVAATLALATGVNVAIPRQAGRQRTILAASDLATPGYPVLREAALLAASLCAVFIPFHNIDPLAVGEEADGTREGAGLPEAAVRLPRARLELAAKAFVKESEPSLRAQIDPVSAIVEEARAVGAEWIMVGAHERTRLERVLYGSVAARVSQRATCSVLVTPLVGSRVLVAPDHRRTI